MNFVILLSFGPLIFSSLEALSHAVGNPTHQLKGILGGSILFPANVSQGITVQKMEWDFRPQKRDLGYWQGEFSHWNRDHQSPTGRFGQRLGRVNETTLRLKDLELDDSGIYNTRIWFTKTQFQEQRFNLIVYEPVSTPQIDHQVESKTPGGCNVTLRCHTPGREDLSISWETGDPHRALGKSVNQYQVSNNGRELRVSFWNSSLGSKFTCLVSNPVDQRRASFDLLNICQSDGGGHSEDGDYEVDTDTEDFPSSSKLPRESFPSLSSYAVSETEPSEIPHGITQSNMEYQGHLLEPLPRNSLKVPQGKDPLKISQGCQLSRSYSLPSISKHSSQKSCDQDREQNTKTYPVTMGGLSLRARSPRTAFITSTSKSV